MQLGCSSNVLLFKAHIAQGGLPDRSKSLSLARQQLSDVRKWLSNSTMSVCMHLHHTCHAISWCGESHRGLVNLHDENAGDMNSSEQRRYSCNIAGNFFQHLQLLGKRIKYGMYIFSLKAKLQKCSFISLWFLLLCAVEMFIFANLLSKLCFPHWENVRINALLADCKSLSVSE